ncbi:FT-like protein [Senna tora]|uniref:FT-like protein n=1 Tax=Senna tora TaxID=362788 RepID=A0A834TC30_9FABA|nr:FT-like protein [Senna tora]
MGLGRCINRWMMDGEANIIKKIDEMSSNRGGSGDPLVVGGVIGDVVEAFENSIPLRVWYGGREVSNGCELRPSHVVNQPRVTIGGHDLRHFYTLVS